MGRPLAVRRLVHGEDRAPRLGARTDGRRRDQPDHALDECADALTAERRAEVHRVQRTVGGPVGEGRAEPVRGRLRPVRCRSGLFPPSRARAHQLGEDRLVGLRHHFGDPRADPAVLQGVRHRVGPRGAEARHGGHRDGDRSQQPADVREQRLVPRAGPVDLVDEQQGGQPQPPQGLHQHPGPGLDALHRRQQQHGAVEHPQRPLDLGGEVGVAGGVEKIDLGVADGEGGDGGADRDAALPLQLAGVRTGVTGVDAAEPADGTGVEQQPLGEAGLTRVDVGENPDVQGARKKHGRWIPQELSSGWGDE